MEVPHLIEVDFIVVVVFIGKAVGSPFDEHFGDVKGGNVATVSTGFNGIKDDLSLLFKQVGSLSIFTNVGRGDGISKVKNFNVRIG